MNEQNSAPAANSTEILSDEAIVGLYWQRNDSAISETVRKWGAYCTSIARAILGSDADAEECLSDTCLAAWNAIPPHRPQTLSTFLGKLTRRIAINRYKSLSAQKRGGGETAVILDELSDIVGDRDGGIDGELDRRELSEAIDEFLQTLPQQSRVMFVRRYWYSERVADIAARYGVSAASAAVTLGRVREKMKKYLTERGFSI